MNAVVDGLQTVCGGSFACRVVTELGPGVQTRKHVESLLRDLFLLRLHSAGAKCVSIVVNDTERHLRLQLLDIALGVWPLLWYRVPKCHLPLGVGRWEAGIDRVDRVAEQRVVHNLLMTIGPDNVELLERNDLLRRDGRPWCVIRQLEC